jgi:hypothetical protein
MLWGSEALVIGVFPNLPSLTEAVFKSRLLSYSFGPWCKVYAVFFCSRIYIPKRDQRIHLKVCEYTEWAISRSIRWLLRYLKFRYIGKSSQLCEASTPNHHRHQFGDKYSWV